MKIDILGTILAFALAYGAAFLINKIRKKPNQYAGGRQTITKCVNCAAVLHTVSDREAYGVYGCPFQKCRQCGKEYFDAYYHELALGEAAPKGVRYAYSAGSYEKELAASRLRLEETGYCGKLCDYIGSSDAKGGAELRKRIAAQMQKYMDLLYEKAGAPLVDFRLSGAKEMMDKLTYEAHDAKAVTQLVKDVLTHYGLSPNMYIIQVEYKNDASYTSGDALGTFTRGQFLGGKINVTIQSHYSEYDTVISIVMHECAHAYLALKGISLSDKKENERLTDAAAVFLGGGSYLMRGYYPSRQYRVGYLHKSECEAAGSIRENLIVSDRRKKQTEKAQTAAYIAEKQKKLRTLVNGIVQMKNSLHFAGIIREASVQNRFYQLWREMDEGVMEETELLIKKMTDAADGSDQAMRETRDRAAGLEKRLQGFFDELSEWQEAENWQKNVPPSVIETVRGVETLAMNGNAFAMLERIRFWAACPHTRRDAEIYMRKLLENENGDALCAAGICYLEGLTVKKDGNMARRYFERAVSRGSRDAAVLLKKHF